MACLYLVQDMGLKFDSQWEQWLAGSRPMCLKRSGHRPLPLPLPLRGWLAWFYPVKGDSRGTMANRVKIDVPEEVIVHFHFHFGDDRHDFTLQKASLGEDERRLKHLDHMKSLVWPHSFFMWRWWGLVLVKAEGGWIGPQPLKKIVGSFLEDKKNGNKVLHHWQGSGSKATGTLGCLLGNSSEPGAQQRITICTWPIYSTEIESSRI